MYEKGSSGAVFCRLNPSFSSCFFLDGRIPTSVFQAINLYILACQLCAVVPDYSIKHVAIRQCGWGARRWVASRWVAEPAKRLEKPWQFVGFL